MYLTPEEYKSICPGSSIPDEKLTGELSAAERDIDSLTYNRIRARGFDILTEFQQELVRQAVCGQANFRWENAELLESPLATYGINGVSMSFDSKKLLQFGGVFVRADVYALLRQSGLTFRGLC